MNLRDLFTEAMKKDKDTQEKFLEIFEHCVGKDVMDNSWWDLYTFLYGSHFCESTARKAVDGMKNKDGSYGESITKATSDETAKKLGIVFVHFNEWDWYYAVNMVASDYYGVVDQATYYKIARAWLEDIDVPQGKAFRYWWKVVKGK